MLHRLVIALPIAAVAGAAFAQAPRPGPAPIPRASFLSIMDQEFRKMDADRNGRLAKAEIEAFQRAAAVAEAAARNRALFVQLDSDRNGQLSPAEFAKVTPPATVDARPLIAQHDGNRDGEVSQVEYRTVKLARFDRIDADKDGVASPAEQRAAGIAK